VTGFDREAWILTGFAVLFFTAITVSVCGWILLWRTRRPEAGPAAPPEEAPGPPDDKLPEPPEEEQEPQGAEEVAPLLPPGNPLR